MNFNDAESATDATFYNEKNFDKLIIGTTEKFKNKNISLLEFIDYYKSYKESCLQFYETQKSVFLTMENLNTGMVTMMLPIFLVKIII